MGLEGPGPAHEAAAAAPAAVPAQAVPRFLRPGLVRLLCRTALSRASREWECRGPAPSCSACTQMRRNPRVCRHGHPSAPGYPRADVCCVGLYFVPLWRAHLCSSVYSLKLGRWALSQRTSASAMNATSNISPPHVWRVGEKPVIVVEQSCANTNYLILRDRVTLGSIR